VRRLDGQRVAITGAAGGLGAPVAMLLAQAGAHTIGIDRSESAACHDSIVTDLSDDDALAALAERLTGDTPDILVNIAGVMRFGLHESQPVEALALCYRINLLVPAVLARAVAA
jgi:NAD(P)-dependent dehydrogenase (short-subunit alcohol dehydrogenase family)